MIDVNNITERQKLTIRKGLLDYQYIMQNWSTNSIDFQTVFYEFYLKARWSVMSKPENSIPYFERLQKIDANSNLIDIILSLQGEMAKKSYEFSLCSKMLHTVNPQSPIYDSKVRIYLSVQEDVDFWWHMNKGHIASSFSEIEKIKHDWDLLCNWYSLFLSSQRGEEWVCWFNNNFPEYKSISDVKKIDFIIFATT